MTLPNKITITRICLIPVFVMFALYYGRSVAKGHPEEWFRWVAVATFVIAAASDGIDGYIARKYHQMSKLGQVLDPIADKGLMLSAIITLSVSQWQYEFPIWFPVFVITRDTIILLSSVLLHVVVGRLKVTVTMLGKLTTFSQMFAISAVLLWPTAPWKMEIFGNEIHILDIPVTVAGFFTLISGLHYARVGLRKLHEDGHGDPKRKEDLLD